MLKFEVVLSDFDFQFWQRYDEYGLTVFLEKRGLRPTPTPYYLWVYVVVVQDKIIDSGLFRWSTATRERLTDREVADTIANFHAGTTLVKQAQQR